jgi:hypothetical protein
VAVPRISALTRPPVDMLRDGPERSLHCALDRRGPKELPSTGPGRCQSPIRSKGRGAGAASAAPEEPVIALLLQRARLAVHDGRLRPHDRARPRRRSLEFKAHPDMLRHACGYALANKGHDTRAIQGWLGHRSITSNAVSIRGWRRIGSRNKLVGTGAVGGAFEGRSVALSGDGNTALVGGAYDNSSTGAVWVFTRHDGV